MSALLQSLASGFEDDAGRRAALEAVLQDGLPGPRSEAWKYTPLRALERREFASADHAPEIDATLLEDIPAPRLVFVNGRHAPALSDMAGLDAGVETGLQASAAGGDDRYADRDAVFARLAASLAREGVQVKVPAGTRVEAPLHVVFVGAPQDGAELAWHLRHRIELGEGARLALIEHHLVAGDHRHLDNALMEIEVGANGVLEHARIQSGSDGATAFLRTQATLQESAHYRRVDLELGGALSRHELNVQLVGDNARADANGVLLADGRRHLDTRLGIEHIARDTSSGLLWRGMATGRGRVVFHGGITIQAGADGTDAKLSNKNLLLAPNAEIDTQPVLVIHADEVEAAHGATVGQLDEEALFYLRTRGLSEREGRILLTEAFTREPLSAVEDPVLREALEKQVVAKLQGVAG
ncbi:MAG: Fe-S cluster assembly protein SufD [Gammaproteobacteria bacterium]|nr:Fe-S cluster assembly protein SufD [Gammaproteobacteria bacterium]